MALRAVKPGETPAPKKKQTVEQAATSGTHRDLLVAMRDRIAQAVSSPDCPPRDLAALTRRLLEMTVTRDRSSSAVVLTSHTLTRAPRTVRHFARGQASWPGNPLS